MNSLTCSPSPPPRPPFFFSFLRKNTHVTRKRVHETRCSATKCHKLSLTVFSCTWRHQQNRYSIKVNAFTCELKLPVKLLCAHLPCVLSSWTFREGCSPALALKSRNNTTPTSQLAKETRWKEFIYGWEMVIRVHQRWASLYSKGAMPLRLQRVMRIRLCALRGAPFCTSGVINVHVYRWDPVSDMVFPVERPWTEFRALFPTVSLSLFVTGFITQFTNYFEVVPFTWYDGAKVGAADQELTLQGIY